MKIVHKIKWLYCFLSLLLLVIFSFVNISKMKINAAFSSPISYAKIIKPIQRPASLAQVVHDLASHPMHGQEPREGW